MKFERFENIITDRTAKYNKINKELYLTDGEYCIIDQGKEFIGGYTNDKNLIVDVSTPIIIFGDHTRALKYVDFPIAIGADGVKVLHINTNKAFPKYVYYYLKSVKLFDAGYSRHFKFLKEVEIPIPSSLNQQIHIANILTKAESLIAQRKQSIGLLDAFLKSTFLEMFGDPVRNEKGWEKVPLKEFGEIVTGNTPPRNETDNFSEKFIEWIKTDNIESGNLFVTKAIEYLSEKGLKRSRSVEKGALLVACIAGSIESIGRACLTDRKVAFNQQINAIQPNKDINPYFLYCLFKNSKPYIQNHTTKGMKKILTKGEFEKILMIAPPIKLQNQFAHIVAKTETLKQQYQQSLQALEQLFGSLSQRAFKGELVKGYGLGEANMLMAAEDGVGMVGVKLEPIYFFNAENDLLVRR